MARPTIHKDGTPLTATERQRRWREKKRAEREERIHDACAIHELAEIERKRKALLAEQERQCLEQIRRTHGR